VQAVYTAELFEQGRCLYLLLLKFIFMQLVLCTLHKQSCWLLVHHTECVELFKNCLQDSHK
jgi:hypothetical protein